MKDSIPNYLSSSHEVQIFLKSLILKPFSIDEPYSRTKKEVYLITSKDQEIREWKQILFGVCSLRLFCALNWTGLKRIPNEASSSSSPPPPPSDLDSLDPEGIGLFEVIHHPELLLDVRDNLLLSSQSSWIVQFWKLRACYALQSSLRDTSESIYLEGKKLIAELSIESKNVDRICFSIFHLEALQFFSLYRDIPNMEIHLKSSAELLNLKITETGALGRRTKFQSKDVAQFALDVIVDEELENQPQISEDFFYEIPKDINLNDEVRLEKIKFIDERSLPTLQSVSRNFILATFIYILKSQPPDCVLREETLPYLQAVLNSNRIWSFQASALLQRSKLESKEHRTIERAMMQVEIIKETLETFEGSQAESAFRNFFLFSSFLSPFWIVEAEAVKLYLSVGSTKSALDSALKVGLWEEVIACYHLLQLRHKAAEVIREKLAVQETPLLLCMLGDATDDIENYYKALKISNNRNSRAFKSLGYHYYFKKDYVQAVHFMKKSLECNGFQQHLLLRLGFSAMEIEDWESASNAYRRYCTFETDNFEAWNNLANAYIKTGQKARAWKVLQESVKCDYDNWKVWDNIMVVSIDLAHFDEAIRAYNRILDIKEGKHIDIEILQILVQAVIKNLPDAFKNPSRNSLIKPLLTLFGRLTSVIQSESKIWELFSDLIFIQSEQNEESSYKIASYLHKALASLTKKHAWASSTSECHKIINLAIKSIQSAINAKNFSNPESKVKPLMSSIKLTIKGIIANILKTQLNSDGTIISEIQPNFVKLQSKLDNLIQCITIIKE